MTKSRSSRVPKTAPSPEAVPSPPAFLSDEERQRFERLLERTMGLGFKLVVIETPTPRDRRMLLDWLETKFVTCGATMKPVDLVELLGRKVDHSPQSVNVWSALQHAVPPESVADHRAALVLWGAEELMYHGKAGRSDLLQQFNVQRDLFVRDYPCWWLILIHPASRQQWKTVAPDFCDFVSLWIEASVSEAESTDQRTIDLAHGRSSPSVGGPFHELPMELRAAQADFEMSRYDQSLDHIHSFRAATVSASDSEWELAIADLLEGDIVCQRGEPDNAMHLWQDRALPIYTRLGDARAQAVTMGRIADILQVRGELDEALRIRREEVLPVFEQQGDMRERAITTGKIADILQARGELVEALHIHREELLPIFERLGDMRDRAMTLGKIADILQARGELDEALRIHREERLPVYVRLGDRREIAVTKGQIADILRLQGNVDETLRILQEDVLPDFKRLNDLRSWAVTEGRIADILESRGQLDEAHRIRTEEELPSYEQIGDVRARAVTMGKIANILQARGELDRAIRIRREDELPVFERLGDVGSLIVGRTNLALMLIERGHPDEDAEEIVSLLNWSRQEAQRLRLPVAGQIEATIRHLKGD